MTDDQSRRPDPSLNPDEVSADELPTDDGPIDDEALEPEPTSASAEPEPEPEPEAAPEPEPERKPGVPPAATSAARATKPTSGQATRNVGYRGSLPPRNDHIARPWVITVIAIFVLIFLLAIAELPSRLLPDATPAPIPSFSLQPVPSSSVVASPQ
ncbi:MAG: hypothetical protein ABI534_10425 [Chloroflexota bacterium]